MRLALTLTAVLAVWNNALNLVRPGRYAYVVVNAAAAAGVVALGRAGGLTSGDMGLEVDGLPWAAALSAAAALAVAAGSRVRALRRWYDDRRLDGVSRRGLLYAMLVRIPVGTALLEEVAFRGVLLGAWQRTSSTAVAVAVSSLVFGLWHIVPSIETLRINGREPRWTSVGAMCAATVAAGVGFCALRLGSGSVLPQILLHAAINSSAMASAYAASRRATSSGSA